MTEPLVRATDLTKTYSLAGTTIAALAGVSLAGRASSVAVRLASRSGLRRTACSGYALALQVEPSARDAGAFVFRVPGVGLYSGHAGTGMRVLSASSVVVRYDGPAILGPQVTATATAPAAPPRTVIVKLQAQVNPSRRTAEATLTYGSQRYHLVVRNVSNGGVLQTLKQFEDAMVATDWAVLYEMMNRDLRAAYTPSSFAAQGNDQVATVGRVSALHRLAVSDVQTNDNGAMFVVVTYSAQMRSPAGALTTADYDIFFIPELGSWKMWYSAPR